MPVAPSRWKLFGDEDADVVAGGHSHTSCLIFALDTGLRPPTMRVAIAYPADFGEVGAEYWDYLADAGAGRTVALVWEGNQHNAAFLIKPDPPFRVYGATAAPGPPEEQPGSWVPREMIGSYWGASFEALAGVLSRLVQRSRVLVIGTPPPKPDARIKEILQGKLEWDPWINEIASTRGQEGSELLVSPASLRLALWSVVQERLREEAGRSGATFVPVPEAARDPAGLLLPAFCPGDLTHANYEYGGLLWAHIEAVVRAA